MTVFAHPDIAVACRSGENSRIFKEEKDLMTQPKNCWRITAKNANIWKMRFRNYVKEM